MNNRDLLESHGLAHLSDILAQAGFQNIEDLQSLAHDEDALEALNLRSKEARALCEALRKIPSATPLPTVLALPLLEFERERQPVLALWAMCDFAELVLKLCVMAAAAEHRVLPEQVLRVFYNRIERPTLGGWHDMAQVAVEHLPEDSLLPQLPSTFESIQRLLGTEAQGPTKSLLCVRNRLAHARPTNDEAAAWLKTWKQPIRHFAREALAWLGETRFVAVDQQRRHCLLRGESGREIEEKGPVPVEALPGSAWLCVGEKALSLGLLATFDFEGRAPMVYMRTQDLGLHYLRVAPAGGVWESGMESWQSFRQRFVQAPKAANSPTIRSFEEEILRESQRRIGREAELRQLLDAVIRLEKGCLWVGGPAGIGKSNLMASLMQRLQETPPEHVLVLPYRFHSQDNRNSRAAFLTYFREQLELSGCLAPQPEKQKSDESEKPVGHPIHRDPVNEVVDRLALLGPDRRILLVVDGLDEIAEKDARFVDDVLLRFLQEGIVIVGSGRPELGIPESFRRHQAIEPFPEGMAPMREEEVRTMLLESLFGASRRGLLESDREEEGCVQNAFVSQVARRSEGLPVYVNYVIGDIFARRIRPDNPDHLPRGLHAYHEELLRRCAVGDLQAVVTPMLVTLALACEPLCLEEVAALLQRFGRLETVNVELVERGLKALGSMLCRTSEPNGKSGIKIYHHSLLSHILQSAALVETVASIKRAFADASTRPSGDPAENYLYRHGVRHLLEVSRFDEALNIQTDFQLLMTRFRKLDESGHVAENWYNDWDRLQKAGIFEGDALVWWNFARTHRHYFRREGWESWRVLFQAAIDHADDSPLTIAAERFLAEGRVDWIWLRYINRPRHFVPDPLAALMVGHTEQIDWAIELNDGRIVSLAYDSTIRIWDNDTGKCERVLDATFLQVWDEELPVFHFQILDELWELGDEALAFVTTKSLHILQLDNSQHFSFDLTSRTSTNKGASEIGLPQNEILDRLLHNLIELGHQSGYLTFDELTTYLPEDLNDPEQMELIMNGIKKAGIELIDSEPRLMIGYKVGLELLPPHKPRLMIGSDCLTYTGRDGNLVALRTGDRLEFEGEPPLGINQNTLSNTRLASRKLTHAFKASGYDVQSTTLRDGCLLQIGSDRSGYRCMQVFNPSSAQYEDKFFCHYHQETIGAIELKDGRILSWSDTRIFIWIRGTGNTHQRMTLPRKSTENYFELKNHELLVVNHDQLRILNPHTGKCRITINDNGGGFRGAMELQNNRILSWSKDKKIRIWSLVTGEREMTLSGHKYEIQAIHDLQNGTIVSWDYSKLKTKGSAFIWNIDTRKRTPILLEHKQEINGILPPHNNKFILWQANTIKHKGNLIDRKWTITTWNCSTNKRDGFFEIQSAKETRPTHPIPFAVPRQLQPIQQLKNGGLLLNIGYKIRHMDPNTGKISPKFTGNISPKFISEEYNFDGHLELKSGKFLTIDTSKTIRIYSQADGKFERLFTKHRHEKHETVQIRELRDGRIASRSRDSQNLYIWDPNTGQCTTTLECGLEITDFFEISDGRIALWSCLHELPPRGQALIYNRKTNRLELEVSTNFWVKFFSELENNTLAFGGNETIILFSSKSRENLSPLDKEFNSENHWIQRCDPKQWSRDDLQILKSQINGAPRALAHTLIQQHHLYWDLEIFSYGGSDKIENLNNRYTKINDRILRIQGID